MAGRDDHHPSTGDDRETPFRIRVDSASAGIRFDHFLVGHYQDVTRTKIAASIKSGSFTINGHTVKSSYKLKEGDVILGSLEEAPPLDVKPDKVEFPILFEDEHLLVLSKPPGLVVHPGSGNLSGTLVHGLVYHCETIAGVGDEVRPGIVHRLDKDTSGAMVVAKTGSMHHLLVEAFKSRLVKKEYIALVHGVVEQLEGRIVAPIGRHSVNRQKMAVREHTGRYAVSSWSLLEVFADRYSLLRVTIETGRTHQIRVHMAYLKHPVAGDLLYGSGRDNRLFPRQMLHAARLAFIHPATGREMVIEAPLWPDFAELVSRLARAEEERL